MHVAFSAIRHRYLGALTILSAYSALRVFFFLSNSVVANEDTWAFVAPGDDVGEILQSKSTRPGFVYQLLLRALPISAAGVFTQDEGIRFVQFEDTPTIAGVTFVISLICWVFMAVAAYQVGGTRQPSKFFAAIGVLFVSLMPAVWVWDNVLVGDGLSISFTVAWLASFLIASRAHRHPYPWFFASLILMFLSFGVRPSNAPVMIGASLVFLALALEGIFRSRVLMLGWLTAVWLVANLTARTLEISHRWTGIWGDVVSANRSTALLVLPRFVEAVESKSGNTVCDSALIFASSQWDSGNYGSWGGVTAASLSEKASTGCIGGWNELGQNSPGWVEMLLTPGIQAQWWSEFFPRAMDPLPGPLLLEQLNVPSFLITVNSTVLGQGWLSLLLWVALGTVLGLIYRPDATVREILVIGITGAGSLAGFWLLSTLDGGAFDRHGAPYNLIVPILAFLLALLSSAKGAIYFRNRMISTTRYRISDETA